ncbi:hypothetical protein PMI07_003110 [Rhizobium sp. CF080]|nr:hypothetical protein [Rhizobium sp. CF080]EUB95332.1 hypothetical protein PMI07_003110 [Rhizobium sp. CF080]
MNIEQLILFLTPVVGIGLVLLALRIHDRITGFPFGKGKGK